MLRKHICATYFLKQFQVELSLTFLDTSDDSATPWISGELTYLVDGESVPFSSYGMIEILVSSVNNALTASGV